MGYESVPAEMKQLNQWVCCWDNSKIPMRAFERRAASSVDPTTWSDFETAVQAVNEGYYDHIGFVFADNGLVGIDIDCGFEDGLLTPLCADAMQRCGSYTEVSRSGRGVHILMRGVLPFPGKNNLGGVEIYRSRRFFIVTGKVLIFPEVKTNQQAIDYVVQTYFKDTVSEREKAPRAQRLYQPTYLPPKDGTCFLRPEYPLVLSGGRNLSMTSLAGQMHTTGYDAKAIYQELLYANSVACQPPLPAREIATIVNSVTKYRRDT